MPNFITDASEPNLSLFKLLSLSCHLSDFSTLCVLKYVLCAHHTDDVDAASM